MDRPDAPINTASETPPGHDPAAVRAMLEQSRRDIAEGRVVPLQPALDRLRERAAAVRRQRTGA